MKINQFINQCISKAIFIVLLNACTNKQDLQPAPLHNEVEMPKWTLQIWESAAFKDKYAFDFDINPFYISADFDNDGSLDLAVLIKENASGKKGVLLVRQSNSAYSIFGAGRRGSLWGDNWNWLKTWKAEAVLPAGVGRQVKGGALILYSKNKESTAPWLYWNGNDWTWQDD